RRGFERESVQSFLPCQSGAQSSGTGSKVHPFPQPALVSRTLLVAVVEPLSERCLQLLRSHRGTTHSQSSPSSSGKSSSSASSSSSALSGSGTSIPSTNSNSSCSSPSSNSSGSNTTGSSSMPASFSVSAMILPSLNGQYRMVEPEDRTPCPPEASAYTPPREQRSSRDTSSPESTPSPTPSCISRSHRSAATGLYPPACTSSSTDPSATKLERR